MASEDSNSGREEQCMWVGYKFTPDERGVDRPFPEDNGRTAVIGDLRKKNSRLGLKWIMDEYRLHPSLFETICSAETEEIILCRIQHKGRAGAADKRDGDSFPTKVTSVADKRRIHGWRDLPPGAWQLMSLVFLG
ncbi:hypothetical protein C4D60_Mb02t09570 [Musa balbisiana]|uniref:NAC domain-containing protein n=1 Tax=Musa balbisiana TaxID=52838 RepID=A0A4V4H2J8_MUSBA|nr:hypothetical protein C4D60_Mb02t09570 [Musa balbisiana]